MFHNVVLESLRGTNTLAYWAYFWVAKKMKYCEYYTKNLFSTWTFCELSYNLKHTYTSFLYKPPINYYMTTISNYHIASILLLFIYYFTTKWRFKSLRSFHVTALSVGNFSPSCSVKLFYNCNLWFGVKGYLCVR